MIRRALLLGLVALPGLAAANPRPLPFSYHYETLAKGDLELEQFVDFTPVRVPRENLDGTLDGVTSLRSQLETEVEYGITDRLELGLYMVFRQSAVPDAPSLRFQGIKQRLRLRLAEAGEWPVDVGLYFEVAEFHNEIELEQKILLAKRLDRLLLVVNLWVEQEFYFQTDEQRYIFNPTAGAVWQFSPNFMLGAEYWARGRFNTAGGTSAAILDDIRPTTHHYLGPTVMLQSGEYWLTLGGYARLDGLGDSLQVNDPFGKLFFRMVVGIGM